MWKPSWNVHVYGTGIKDSFSFCRYTYMKNHYLNWENYGRYNYTYMIWKDNVCKITQHQKRLFR